MDLLKVALLLEVLVCTVSSTEVDGYTKTKGAWIVSFKKDYPANTLAECAAKCEAETSFICKSFTYDEKEERCWTTADNSKTVIFHRRISSTVYEKNVYLLECVNGVGMDYRGTLAVTKSGRTCQKWAENEPHKPSAKYTPESNPPGDLESNYCRNVNGDSEAPWCYTTDPNSRYEFCNLRNCTEECIHCSGEDYRGTISTTENGFTCQRWDSQTPQNHEYNPDVLPGKHLEENYCRNPGTEPRPWCYTTDPSKRWDYCSIPRCTSEPPTIIPETTCASNKGELYRGTIAVTESGKTCQNWSAQTPQKHGFVSDSYPCKGLVNNYCRNPDNDMMPWCYTTDPESRWEYCSVQTCENEAGPEECIICSGEDYRGTISTTENGFTCQRWDSQTPQNHEYNPDVLPGKHLEENYCRNPDTEPRPWCYTTDPSKRWDYCSIPRCTSEPPTIIPETTCASNKGELYRGTIAVTESGKTCQNWSAQTPQKHGFVSDSYPCKGLVNNYCRNPDNDMMPWCYTTDPESRWEYCSVQTCENEAGPEECIICSGEDYRGTISTTENGFTCQRWDSQTPQNHEYNPDVLPGKHLEENYCRNPDTEPRPWCYTTDPSKRWDYCSIPRCTSEPPTIIPETTCASNKGELYRGTIAVTESGKTCQNWSAQTPHKHRFVSNSYPCKGLDNNYCRNPSNDTMPWCYTTDPETRWEYCSVPSCEDSGALKKPNLCNGRIVGGCVSNANSWPWKVILRSHSGSHTCGGTLIHPQWVVTAADCLDRIPLFPDYTVLLGINSKRGLELSKQERTIEDLCFGHNKADIALLKLNRPAQINDRVLPACLPEKDCIVPNGTECFTIGWGETLGTGGERFLKEIAVRVIENQICNEPSFLNGRVKDHEMCAGRIGEGVDSCQGDSGGPLVCKTQNGYVLQGVKSWSLGCANAMKPSVYIQVSKFVAWINSTIQNN